MIQRELLRIIHLIKHAERVVTMIKFRWWGSWSSDKFRNYLEEITAKGYVMGSIGFGMNFDQKEPEKIRYCVDYINHYTEEYELLLEDDGWVCKGSSSGRRVWAKKSKINVC
jgi:hypothetical protein